MTNSVAARAPAAAAEWANSTRNGPAVPPPTAVLYNSRAAVWFKCAADAGHGEYRAAVAAVVAGSAGCPVCSGEAVTRENSLRATLGAAAASLVDARSAPRLPPAMIRGDALAPVRCRDALTGNEPPRGIRPPVSGYPFECFESFVPLVASNSRNRGFERDRPILGSS